MGAAPCVTAPSTIWEVLWSRLTFFSASAYESSTPLCPATSAISFGARRFTNPEADTPVWAWLGTVLAASQPIATIGVKTKRSAEVPSDAASGLVHTWTSTPEMETGMHDTPASATSNAAVARLSTSTICAL